MITLGGLGTGQITTSHVLDGTVATADIADNAVTVGKVNLGTTWQMSVPGVSGVATDALNGSIAGADRPLDLTATETAAAFAVVEDASDTNTILVVSSSLDGYTNDYQMFPDVEAENDAVYFGATIPFCEIQTLVDDVGTPATYIADSIIWEYYNGGWTTLMSGHGLYDSTDTDDQDGDRPFQGNGVIIFIPPSDWIESTVFDQMGYWVRARCTATVDITQIPITDGVEHKVVTPTDGFKCPETGTIVGIRLTNANTTAHTTTDIKFFLHNFTTGVHSDELTFAQDKRNDRWDSTAFKTGGLAVAAGDVLGVVITQEDSAQELTNFVIEMDVDL